MLKLSHRDYALEYRGEAKMGQERNAGIWKGNVTNIP